MMMNTLHNMRSGVKLLNNLYLNTLYPNCLHVSNVNKNHESGCFGERTVLYSSGGHNVF